MKIIYLSNGEECQVDDEDYGYLRKLFWSKNSGGYATNSQIGSMHRFLMKASKGLLVDHKNGSKLDNRKSNLRLCQKSENRANSAKNKLKSSKYKGVCFINNLGKWLAYIHIGNKLKYLKYHKTQEDAAQAYNIAALEHFGQFAKINIL